MPRTYAEGGENGMQAIKFDKPAVQYTALPDPADFDTFVPFLKGVFSQWHFTPFNLDGQSFVAAEQWMMFAKALLFGDLEVARQILASPDPSTQKRLGQLVSGFEPEKWNEWKIDIVYRGNIAKFSQNPGALRQLRNTGKAMLVEANPRDWIWGVGRGVDDPLGHSPKQWRGQNLLGLILTKVRDDLSAAPA
ncbi:NADAR family protein [Novosphingobium sp. UBA1939]|uniref:NADAR family protein n=1 Tax=Novosphingobium sp. UBA1939 TaxID=1946982 RepID=UPI0025E58E15|nr:NADAR family protein [Novosphingobium sp. UBA1939]